jgi:hypothetical protein
MARAGVLGKALALAAVFALAMSAPTGVLHAEAQAQSGRFLAKEDILLFGLGLQVEPAQQTIPKDIATIVSTMFVAPQVPSGLPPLAPDAVVMATLRGPTFPTPIDLTTKPNSPFNIPPLNVAGIHTLDNIRLVSNGEIVLRGSPESVVINVIDRLLITEVTARPLTAAEIREKGLVFDNSSFQAYNFSAAFAIQDRKIPINFTVVLPTLQGATDVSATDVRLPDIGSQPGLPSLQTVIPDSLKRLKTQIPNLNVQGFTLKVPKSRIELLRAADPGRGRHPRRYRFPQPVLQRDADGRERRARGIEPHRHRSQGRDRPAARRRHDRWLGRRSAADGPYGSW